VGGGGVEVDDVTTRVGKEEEGGQVTGGLHTRLLLPVLLPCTSGSISQRYGSLDPDPCQNFMDPQQQHW
jgi:hypothetical protein